MLPKKVKKRASLLSIFLLLSVIGVFLILNALNKNILYFNSPTDIKISQDINYNKKMRVGGMVKKNTLNIKDQEIRFIITDFKNEVEVSFKGTIPNLFAEGKGVVAEGKLQDKKFFIAERILAKHDENYMPPELKNIMKENQKIKCVNCDKEFDVTLVTKPFCSKRCSYIDLNNWLGEKYSIHINEEDYEKDV